MRRLKSSLVSKGGHSQRRTRSESDVKRAMPPEAKRAKLEKQASRSSSIDEDPPNDREPPEVGCLQYFSLELAARTLLTSYMTL